MLLQLGDTSINIKGCVNVCDKGNIDDAILDWDINQSWKDSIGLRSTELNT